jgi:hypothetical protein
MTVTSRVKHIILVKQRINAVLPSKHAEMQKLKLLEWKGLYYEPGVWDLVACSRPSTFPVLRHDRQSSDK